MSHLATEITPPASWFLSIAILISQLLSFLNTFETHGQSWPVTTSNSCSPTSVLNTECLDSHLWSSLICFSSANSPVATLHSACSTSLLKYWLSLHHYFIIYSHPHVPLATWQSHYWDTLLGIIACPFLILPSCLPLACSKLAHHIVAPHTLVSSNLHLVTDIWRESTVTHHRLV